MRIALLGAFDIEDCGRASIPRVVEAELRRRLPAAVVTVFAPLGRLRPLAFDGGRSAEPLAALDAEGMEPLAERFDCMLVCTEDALAAPERAAQLWGDAAAASLLRDPPDATGVAGSPVIRLDLSHAGGSVPPPALLLPRLLDARLLESRIGFLRLMGWAWEAAGPVVTVQGDAGLLGAVDTVAAALLPLIENGTAAVQLAASGRLDGEEAFADALAGALGGRCRRLPGVAAIEDLASLVAASTAVVGATGVGLWLAAAMGKPAATRAPEGRDDGTGALLDELGVVRVEPARLAAGVRGLLDPGTTRPDAAAAVGRLDRYLDRLAGSIRAAAPARPAQPLAGAGVEALRKAHDARGRQLIAERRAFQSELDAAVRDLEVELREARDEAARLRSELAAARAANDQIVDSRTWRYSQPVRDTLSRVRERRR
jgi:hypothetical protein